jgi:hypothetical protein
MCKSTNNSSNTSINPTDKANKSITEANNLALRHGHSQLEPLHLCCILFAPGELGRTIWDKSAGGSDLDGQLRACLNRFPTVQPPPLDAISSEGTTTLSLPLCLPLAKSPPVNPRSQGGFLEMFPTTGLKESIYLSTTCRTRCATSTPHFLKLAVAQRSRRCFVERSKSSKRVKKPIWQLIIYSER